MWSAMNDIFGYWFIFAQDGGAAGNQTAFDPFGMLMPLIAIGFLFYFLMIMPERKRRRKHEEMLGKLKKNDRIVTVGGIYGTVVNIQKDAEDVTIKVDENSNTRIRITRGSIGQVIKDDAQSTSKED